MKRIRFEVVDVWSEPGRVVLMMRDNETGDHVVTWDFGAARAKAELVDLDGARFVFDRVVEAAKSKEGRAANA